MYKLVIITNSESAPGFRLAGVDVFEADKTSDARKLIVDFINDDSAGVVGVDEDIMNEMDDQLKNRIDKLYRPVIVPIPSKKKVDLSDARTAYVQSIIKKAVGFDIKLK